MRLFSGDKPKIKIETIKADGFSGWFKCSSCEEMVHSSELSQNLSCCPKCNYHYRMPVNERIELLVDEGSFQEKFNNFETVDRLEFEDSEKYSTRIARAKKQSGREEAIVTGLAKMKGQDVALAIMDFSFMAGSMGSVVGEKLTCLIELAYNTRTPLVIVSASGGARMQESIFSLMQMAKTSAALARLHDNKVPYISVLTNPTTGGITASFASLGDIIIAEPEALICFAGPRVVEQVIREKLPPGAQKSEFLLKHGMIDCIVKRSNLRDSISKFVYFLTNNERAGFNSTKDSSIESLAETMKGLLS